MSLEVGYLTGEWDHAELPDNVSVGEGCFLERGDAFSRFFSERDIGLKIGDRVRAYTWTSFSVEPHGVLKIGDDCVLVGALFMCSNRIDVGDRVYVAYNVTIADCDFHPLDPEQRKLDAIAISPEGDMSARPSYPSSPVIIEDDVSIGIGSAILKGVRIGRGAQVLPGSVVTGDVHEGAVVSGNPARTVKPASR